jgi:phosphoribosylanthranilate isomerase
VPKVAVYGRVVGAPPQTLYDLVQGIEWETYPFPATKRLHVIRIRNGQKPEDLTQQTINASAILLDAYREEAFGGTGHKVDWGIAAEIVQRAQRPVILAGGLTPENVADAIRRVRPYAVDVSSGVEREPGIKDWGKIQAFIAAAKGA